MESLNRMTVIVKDNGLGIKNIIINEPKTYNSLSFKTLNILINIFKRLEKDNKTRVIILSGNGKGFSAGHNLKEVKNLKVRSKYLKLFNLCSKLMLNIVEGRKPVIAKVHGSAFAAGCQLAASCDLAYASTDAKFATPGVNIGLFCSTPMVAVSRKIGKKRMMKMLLTGEPINAKYAKEIGFVNHIYETHEELINGAMDLAKDIASNSPLVIKGVKMMLDKGEELTADQSLDLVRMWSTSFLTSEDLKEGVFAMMEKRDPKFKGK